MTTVEFFEKLLASQALSDEQMNTLSGHRDEVEGYLREKFGQDPTIRYAGSKAKGTMIAESFDLDLTCYFPSDMDKTLKEIHDEVQNILSSKYTIEPKASAVRIKRTDNNDETDYHIDVVPGRFVDGDDGNAFLHVVYGDKERMQTNIDIHIAYVKNSGCQNIIKLLKLWKVRKDVPIKTFVLEIVVVETLKGSQTKEDLPKSLCEVLVRLRDYMESMRLEDPANSKNIVSEVLSVSDKNIIATKAAETMNILEENVKNELIGWQKVFGQDSQSDKTGNEWGKKEAINTEIQNNISIQGLNPEDYSHRQNPPWLFKKSNCFTKIRCYAKDADGNDLGEIISNGRLLNEGFDLVYNAELEDMPDGAEIFWQVVNTGNEAKKEGSRGLRGDFFKGKYKTGIETSDEKINHEITAYTGKHWIQCFVVYNNNLVSFSEPFVVNIFNKKTHRF